MWFCLNFVGKFLRKFSLTFKDFSIIFLQCLPPNCYGCDFLSNFRNKIRLKTVLRPKIPLNCYALFPFFVTIRGQALYKKFQVFMLLNYFLRTNFLTNKLKSWSNCGVPKNLSCVLSFVELYNVELFTIFF